MEFGINSRHCSDATMNRINDRLNEVQKELKEFQRISNERNSDDSCVNLQNRRKYAIDLSGGWMHAVDAIG